MGRFWNLKTKFVAFLGVILLGCFLVQLYVHSRNERRLRDEVVEVSETIANDVAQRLQRLPKRIHLNVHFQTVRRGDTVKLKMTMMVQKVPKESSIKKTGVTPQLVVDAAPPDGDVGLDPLEDTIGTHPVSPSRLQPTPQGSLAVIPVPTATADAEEAEEIDTEPYAHRFRAIFDTYRRHDLLATFGVFLMGIAFAWFAVERMTRPVYQVVEGFQAVSEGNLETSVPEGGSGEFALLGNQFNRMVERLRENRQIEHELEQRERVQLMGDLAAGVAHDVRNPLNAIHLNIGQLRDEFMPADEASRERFLRFSSDAQREVERLNQLVSNFLSLARPTTQDRVPDDVNELLRDLSRLIRKEAAGRQVDVRLDLGEQVPRITWNRQEMMSAFLNVIINALQAMDPDGGSLDVTSGVREREDGTQEAVVSFADTGRGIAEENLSRVFMPYFTTRKGGTGLGMAIARRVTERNDGRIELRSRIGEGTAVSFLFPIAGQEGRMA